MIGSKSGHSERRPVNCAAAISVGGNAESPLSKTMLAEGDSRTCARYLAIFPSSFNLAAPRERQLAELLDSAGYAADTRCIDQNVCAQLALLAPRDDSGH